MNIIKNIKQYNNEHIYFCDPIRNNIMNNGNFIRIMYSTPYFVLNGIYLLVPIMYTGIDKYYNKFRCSFDISYYKSIIDDIYNIEHNILCKCNISGKAAQYKIHEQLRNGVIKIFSNTEEINNRFLLKIAGIWETESEFGLTYKFINI